MATCSLVVVVAATLQEMNSHRVGGTLNLIVYICLYDFKRELKIYAYVYAALIPT